MKSFKQFLLESPEKIIAYHYTHSPIEFSEFKPLTHFGTLHAATSMSVNKFRDKATSGIPRILEVELSFKNLYRLTYDEEESPAELRYNTFNKGLHPQLAEIWTRDIPYLEAFKKMNVDGFVYSNRYDDDGADSYIIFYPRQAKILKTVVRGPRAIKNFQRKMGWEEW